MLSAEILPRLLSVKIPWNPRDYQLISDKLLVGYHKISIRLIKK